MVKFEEGMAMVEEGIGRKPYGNGPRLAMVEDSTVSILVVCFGIHASY